MRPHDCDASVAKLRLNNTDTTLAKGYATAAEIKPERKVSRALSLGKASHTGGGKGRLSATTGGIPVGGRSAGDAKWKFRLLSTAQLLE
jgi:hypothetical protein